MSYPEDCPPPPYELVVSGDWNLGLQPNNHQQQQQSEDQQLQHGQHEHRAREVRNIEMMMDANSNVVEELETLQKKYISLERKYTERENELTELRHRNIELVQKCFALEDELNKVRNERGQGIENTGFTGDDAMASFLGVNTGSERKNCVISGNAVDFTRYSTVSVLRLIPISLKVKVWYEVRVLEYTPPIKENYLCVGWVPEKFRSCDLTPRGVGDPAYPVDITGYGLSFRPSSKNPYKACSYLRGPRSSWADWGLGMSTRGGNVIGVALDKVRMQIMFSMNGNWNEPMGIAYEYVSSLHSYFPAVTACQVGVQINIGGSDFLHGPPDCSFVPVGGNGLISKTTERVVLK